MRFGRFKNKLKGISILIVTYACFLYVRSNKSFHDLNLINKKPEVVVPSCKILLDLNVTKYQQHKAEDWKNSPEDILLDEDIGNEISKGCSLFLKRKKYFLETEDENEKMFGIAFAILAFKGAMQMERLLRTIYRPWNYYCIHVDAQSSPFFYRTINKLVQCLDGMYHNILSTKIRQRYTPGTMSVLSAEIICMRELFNRFETWKYLINLSDQEFPLKTNKELVLILKAYNGANDIDGTFSQRMPEDVPDTNLPFPLVWYKGSGYITANHDFIKYIFKSKKAAIIFNAVRDSPYAKEIFFSTLNFNPQLRIPGSYVGDSDEISSSDQKIDYFLSRFKNWGNRLCRSGNVQSGICVLGIKDLPLLVRAKHLFANKFYENFQPLTLQCLEEWYYEKEKKETLTKKVNVETSFYKSMIFVVNQFRPKA